MQQPIQHLQVMQDREEDMEDGVHGHEDDVVDEAEVDKMVEEVRHLVEEISNRGDSFAIHVVGKGMLQQCAQVLLQIVQVKEAEMATVVDVPAAGAGDV